MNSSVTAGGMKVSAVSSKNLIISTNATVGNDEATSKDSSYTTAVQLTPASTTTVASTQNFFKNTNTTYIDYNTGAAAIGTTFGAATVATSGSTADVVKHTFYVRADDSDNSVTFSNLYVSAISVVDTSNSLTADANISKALRVGVVCGTNGFIYAPVSGATASYNGIIKAGQVASVDETIFKDSSSAALSAPTNALTTYTSASVLASSVAVNTYTTVDVYIWYEGQDAACTSANAVNVENVLITINFSAN